MLAWLKPLPLLTTAPTSDPFSPLTVVSLFALAEVVHATLVFEQTLGSWKPAWQKACLCVMFFVIVRRKFGTGHGNGNKTEVSPSQISVADFCGSFVLLFLLAVRLSFSTWEMRRDAWIIIQDTDGHLLLWLSLKLGCACHGNRGEMQEILSQS